MSDVLGWPLTTATREPFVTLQASMPISQAERLSATDAVFFETSSKTYGDVSVRGLFDVLELGEYRMSLNLGATIPTGRINKQDATPFAASETLPYAMQGGRRILCHDLHHSGFTSGVLGLSTSPDS